MRSIATMVILLFSALTSGVTVEGVEKGSASSFRPTFRRKREFYALTGTSLSEIVEQRSAMALRSEAPKQYGLTTWFAALSTTQGAGAKTSCADEPLSMVVTVTVTLPRAVNSSQFSPADSAQWFAFLPALERHEAKHDSVIVAETSAFLRQVEGERNGPAAMKSISQCLTELQARVNRATVTLDEVTQHGMTEGAVLVLSRTPK